MAEPAEGARLLSEFTAKAVTRVRIPLSPPSFLAFSVFIIPTFSLIYDPFMYRSGYHFDFVFFPHPALPPHHKGRHRWCGEVSLCGCLSLVPEHLLNLFDTLAGIIQDA